MPNEPVPKRDGEGRNLGEGDRIKELRDRLYSRGDIPKRDIRHPLSGFSAGDKAEASSSSSAQAPVHAPLPVVPDAVQYDPMASATRRSYRKKFLVLGLFFFIAAISLSSVFMFMGKNMISGANITLNVAGPLSVGGGEEYAFQVTVANDNTIPIESATLIIEYPSGAHSTLEVNRELTTVRQSLDTIATGETVNVPLKARIFGEENEEKEIKVSVDYRVEGSNATFQKVAEPLRFKVSTSPVVMTFDAVKSISSGQEIDLALTVQSNSPTPLSDLLVKMEYPDGFNFTDADPETLSGEDTWRIAALKPGEKKIIRIQGLMTGYEDETRTFTALAGVANASDRTALASPLAKAETKVVIEKSFLAVDILVNGTKGDTTVINADDVASVEIKYTNALNTAIYDGKVTVTLGGNALDEFEVRADDGFYSSKDNTIVWDSVDADMLKEILPGKTNTVTFSLDPKDSVGSAPEMNVKVTIEGSRVFEDRAPEKLTGAAEHTIKIESIYTLESGAYHESGPFRNTGPTPPVAEETTQYTFTLTVEAGANDVTGAEVTAVVPQYVNWLDLVTEGEKVTYNANTRVMKWTIGDMEAQSTKQVSMQVSFTPSLAQVGTTPTLLEIQRLRATDRFTGTVVRAEHPALTTSLLREDDEDLRDGRVRAN